MPVLLYTIKYHSMGPIKYSLFSAMYNRVVGRPNGDIYHAKKYLPEYTTKFDKACGGQIVQESLTRVTFWLKNWNIRRFLEQFC